jgi:hypothetical protein
MNNNLRNETWLRREYETKSMQIIANDLGVSVGTVRNAFLRFGIKRKDRAEYIRGKPKSEETKKKMSDKRKEYWECHTDRDDFRIKISNSRRRNGTQSGYPAIYIIGRGYVHAHRYIMEQIIGRELSKDEVVHHVDGNRMNNSPDNLLLTTHSEHASIHDYIRKKDKLGRYK